MGNEHDDDNCGNEDGLDGQPAQNEAECSLTVPSPGGFLMSELRTHRIPYQEIENGALILWLLRSCKKWEELCERFEYASPPDIEMNTTVMSLYHQLVEMRSLSLVAFEERVVDGKKIIDDVKPTELSQQLRVALGGMSLSDAALLSRHARGVAIEPVFGRPRPLERKLDVFVLMPFNARMESVYSQHIKKLGPALGVSIERADDEFSPAPFMEKVWDGICAAELVIADCTDRNPNVFYEVGIAHTVGKKVVILTRSKKDIPSDLRQFEYIEYVYDPEGVTALIDTLRAVLVRHLGLEYPRYPGEPIGIGAAGPDVRRWQARMAERGWKLAVDGVFGQQTARVCTKFQEEKGLHVDGVVGPQTWSAAWNAPLT